MRTHLRPAIVLTLAFTLLTGIAYPLAMTGIAGALFPAAASGSLIERDGRVIGSVLIAQPFAALGYLHPRPSASDWNAAGTGASNLGPTSAVLIADVAALPRRGWRKPAPRPRSMRSPPRPRGSTPMSARRLLWPRPAGSRRHGAPIPVGARADRSPRRGAPVRPLRRAAVNVLQANLALDAAFPMPPRWGAGDRRRMTPPDADARPSPDALLSQAAREGRGRLKIFLGAAPGVGKTWAMLEDGHRKLAEGVDVLAALVETHGRAETQAKLVGLPLLPRAAMLYRGRVLTELDLDALLARLPQLALIDELAHTNPEGGRHEKRWQDVEDVLAAGIDVYTTLNIQHIETLNEVVARITGVRVRETVPDSVLELADEIELIDLPRRAGGTAEGGQGLSAGPGGPGAGVLLRQGQPDRAQELAMRAAADRVDAQLREHMAAHAIPGPWPTHELILVCLNESPAAREAIRVAKRSADRARTDWIALSVTSPRSEARTEAEKDQLAGSLRLAERLGAELATIEAGHDVAGAILDFARARNVRRIVLAGRARCAGICAFREDVAAGLLRRSGPFEVIVAPESDGRPEPRRLHLVLSGPRPRALAEAALASGWRPGWPGWPTGCSRWPA